MRYIPRLKHGTSECSSCNARDSMYALCRHCRMDVISMVGLVQITLIGYPDYYTLVSNK